ncbi:MAG: phosphoesterase [Gammaproteobacteria bacterium]|nr:phosphoesterase [Gammaproteobacteria bacterium]
MRGIDAAKELDPQKLLRDTRTFGERISEFFNKPINSAIFLIGITVSIFFLPVIAIIALLMGFIIYFYSSSQKQKLPFRLPQISKLKDFNDLKPGIKTPYTARGIAFFGNDLRTNEELWFANEDMRTHILIFGSTGSGKTETLVSLAFNAMVQASGFIYVDGKGDNSLFAKIFSMVRSMGREDDLLLVNFMTGARDIIGPQEKRLSNTLNPFCQGSSSMLTQLVVNLMGDSGQSSDGDMWKGRAIAFVEALMRVLVYMRDQGSILLDANSIRNYFDLNRLEMMVLDKLFPRDEQDSVSMENVPKVVTDPLRNYLGSLPGWVKEKKGKQVSQVWEQHGYITMQLVRSFSSLADTYGHIIRTNLAEVDFKDVILNRRILVVLLPALEKSPDELSNLGKIIVSSLKAMMAAGLGEEVEGDYRDVIERKPTTAPTPFLCILDEYGYYAVKGFAVVPAQARSLGFSAIFAGQDLPAFQKASKEEAASIGANTNIKICMKLEDPLETWDFFTKTAGEAYVTKVDSFQVKDSSFTNSYLDNKSSSFEKRARIDLLDLKDQTEGEAHIFFKSKIVRAKMFYANPTPVKKLKLNQFLKVEAPVDSYLARLFQQLKHFYSLIEQDKMTYDLPERNEVLDRTFFLIQKNKAEHNLIENSLKMLLEFEEEEPSELEVTETLVSSSTDFATDEGMVNIFSALNWPSSSPSIIARNLEEFSAPIIDAEDLHDIITSIQIISGDKSQASQKIAMELILDLKKITSYPNYIPESIKPEDLAHIVQFMADKITRVSDNSGQK